MPTPFLLPILILASVILNTLGQSLLKLGAGQNPFNLYLFSGLAAYGISTVFYVTVLGKLNVSVVYPVVIGLTILSTTFAGMLLLKEQVSALHWFGIGLMISGISAIAVGKIISI